MLNRTIAAGFIVAVVWTLPAAAFAAQPAAEPQMFTGHSNAAPMTHTVSETGDQISASQAIGTDVRDDNGATMAKVSDLIIDRKDAAVQLAILQPAGGLSFRNGRTTVAWNSLKFAGKPTPHFVTALSRQALAAGASLNQQSANHEDFYDVKTDLLGKTAVGPDRANLGKIKDVVLAFGTGRLVALVIDTGGLIGKENYHVVAWSKAQPQGGSGNSSIRLSLSKAEVEAAPVMIAPQPVASQSGGSTPMIRQDSAGNISGTRIPVPASRR
jgi:sporulation protein YlmC with PRC-barrel domain